MPDTNQPVSFGASQKVQNLFRQVFARLEQSANAFGAVGDGVADDTAALQAWLDAGGGFLNPGTYKITSSLVVNGKVNLHGAGAQSCILIEETTNYLGPAPNTICPIVFGVDETWIGFAREFCVRFTAPMSFQCYVLVLLSAQNSTVERVRFEDLEALGGSTITAYFSGLNIPFTADESQTDIDILYNNATYTPANVGMEFSSNSTNSLRWRWIGNTADGFGDDFIAVRGDSFTIRDNYGVVDLGRIVPASVKNGMIVNNTLVKRNSRGNSGGILIFPQTAGSAGSQPAFEACEDIIIMGNHLINEDDTFLFITPIEVRGGNKITITGNHVIDRELTAASSVRVVDETIFSTYYPLGDISIVDNKLTASNFDIGSNDPGFPWSLVMTGNIVDGADVIQDGYVFNDPNDEASVSFEYNIARNVLNQPYNVDTTSFGGQKLVYQALAVEDIPVDFEILGGTAGEFNKFFMESDSFLTNVRLQFSGAPATGGTIRFFTVDDGAFQEYAAVPFAITDQVQDLVNYSIIGNMSRFLIQKDLALFLRIQPSGGSIGNLNVLAHVGFKGL